MVIVLMSLFSFKSYILSSSIEDKMNYLGCIYEVMKSEFKRMESFQKTLPDAIAQVAPKYNNDPEVVKVLMHDINRINYAKQNMSSSTMWDAYTQGLEELRDYKNYFQNRNFFGKVKDFLLGYENKVKIHLNETITDAKDLTDSLIAINRDFQDKYYNYKSSKSPTIPNMKIYRYQANSFKNSTPIKVVYSIEKE